MQAVMVIPFGSEKMLTRKVAGVPLLIASSQRRCAPA